MVNSEIDVRALIEQVRSIDPESLDREIESRETDLAALRVLSRAAAIRDGDPPKPKAQPKRRKKTAQPVQSKPPLADRPLKERAIEYLRYGQPAKTGILAAELGVTPEDIQATLSQFPSEFELLQVGWIRRRAQD